MQKLIIFIRNPVSGKVKTRLAGTLGDDAALKIYLQLLEHTLNITRDLAFSKTICYSDFIPADDMWKRAGFDQALQAGEDLGSRIHHAFEKTFMEGYDQVILVGSDCPELTPEIIKTAFHQLQDHDSVIGPATDGGYYLLGLTKLQKRLFMNKTWSGNSVLRNTLDDIHELKLTCSLLPELSDIDEEKDLLHLKR